MRLDKVSSLVAASYDRNSLWGSENESVPRYNVRCSQPKVFSKKSVLKNLAKFTGKHLHWSHFLNKVAGLQLATLLKKRFQYRCFPVNFAKFLWTPFFHIAPPVAASVTFWKIDYEFIPTIISPLFKTDFCSPCVWTGIKFSSLQNKINYSFAI